VPLTDEGGAAAPPSPPAARGAIEGVLLLVATLLFLLHWPATTARVLLALLVVVVGVEGAVHSVHHLDSPQDAKSCTIWSVTQQLPVETAPERPSGVPAAHYRGHVVPAASPDVVPPILHPDRGRAPPFPLV
jgi:hypothetical protein